MRPIVNASIVFDLVTVPVGVASAVTTTEEPSFKTLHSACKQPLSMKRVGAAVSSGSSIVRCETCNVEVEGDENIVRGFEYAKGEFVYFTTDELEQYKPARDPVIELHKFVPADRITPQMIEKNYFLIPNAASGTSYGLVYQALAEKDLVGVGHHSLWGKEYPCAVLVSRGYEGGVMMMASLHLYEDLQVPDFSAPIPTDAAMEMPRKFVEMYTDDLDPMVDLTSVSRLNLKAAITAKIEGLEIQPPAKQKADARPPDIQAALAEMIKRKPKKPKAQAKKKATAKS